MRSERAPRPRNLKLPVQFEGELELPSIIGCRGLASQAVGARSGIAQLVDRCDVGAVKKIETVGDQVQFKAFAERNLLGYAKVNLEKPGPTKAIAAEVSVATRRRRDTWNRKRSTRIG